MNNQVLIDLELLERVVQWAALPVMSSAGVIDELRAALQSPAPEGGQLTTDNLWAASKLCGVALMPVAQHQEIVAGLGRKWIACSDRLPEVKKGGEQEFNIAVKRANGKTYVFSACYLNEMELYSEEHGDDEGLLLVTGWRHEMADDEYDTAWHSVIGVGDEVTHWQPLPPSPKEG